MAHDTVPLTNAQTRDIEALLHPLTNAVQHRKVGAHLIESGEGIYIYDDNGRKFIEGMAGLWCCGLGFGDAELIDAAREQLGKLPYYHLYAGRTHEPAIELAEKVKELFPVPMARVFFGCSGSEANETQIKLLWYMMNALGKPEKKKIISRQKAYHGTTLTSGSLTGLPLYQHRFDMPLDFVKHVSCPHYWRDAKPGESEREYSARMAAELEDLILAEGPDTVAAFISEPVMGAGGVIVPPEGYFEAIAAVLQKYDVHWIDDEVICGFGRTGNWFGAETFGMQPASASVAKQITGGYVPLSAVLMNQDMAEAIEAESGRQPSLGHGFTYGGHPLGCAVGVKTLEIYQKRDMLGHVRRVAPLFQEKVRSFAGHPLVGEARGVGLMGALEVSPDPASAATFKAPGKVGGKLMDTLLEHGVILRAIGDSLAICPPMIITEDEIEELFAPMEKCLDATYAWAKKEGHLG
jgi:4-aminobutyrate--pyruvate transaminase